MEKKTIGGFLAALRKANGMTQKDLADRLNVSDKTVSRWEREEGTPDLSLIPVLAELFGVTCDELLRGQRNSPEERAETQGGGASSQRGEKQRQRLWKAALSQYKTQTYIAMGISVTGLLVALICNLAFLKAILGALCGAIFFVASVVSQAVFLNRAFLRVEDGELDPAEWSAFRRRVIELAEKSVGLTVSLLGFTAPLAFADAYAGLNAGDLLVFGLAVGLLFLVIYGVGCYLFNGSLLKRGSFALSEEEAAGYRAGRKRKKTCAILLAVLLGITFLGHQAATMIYGPWSIMEGTTFHDYDSFVAFMEQEVPSDPQPPFFENQEDEDLWTEGECTYYDEFGREISEEEALHRTLKDREGKIVCEYTDRNESVHSLRYTPKKGTVLPITVCTEQDLMEARKKVGVRNVLFGVGYGVETVGVLVYYFVKRAKE